MPAYDTLNPRHRRFLDEYLIDLDGKAAAIRAGYGKTGAASRASEMLARDDVKAALAEKQGKLAAKLEITTEKVVAELAKLGFSNMLDYIRISEDGQPYTDFSALTRDQAAAIGEVTVETRTDSEISEDGERASVPVRKVRFKLADKRAALEAIGRHLGMFKDRVEHTGKDGGPIEVTSEADTVRRIALLFAKQAKERG